MSREEFCEHRITCNRCHVKIAYTPSEMINNAPPDWARLSWNKVGNTWELDLCTKCNEKFEDFMLAGKRIVR